ncbi:dihydrofolate reductase [Rhizobium tibeticum]|uniref:Dihydrofolate reductase n=1 Tax=Rhizobium tibeticum TaxID=501024 RepID=A0A1H8RC03_9HYPH|nr:dihydrofolate reductase [Rhizobium tibeticum]MDP9809572.1 dihydrofolate reductase [Rhizobium tibeticum]SEI07414.1 Dihydrofolate reductase type 3 [Rhizobium tibeticum]SEO63930.1 dihydrofolate reductase [Rhizobium tibeticum]
MSGIRKTIVVAVSKNGIIGRDGDMPWRLSTDLKRFKALTLGKPVIMGRKTYDSIGKPLPGRANVVISRQATAIDHRDVRMAGSLNEAVTRAEEIATQSGEGEICIVGGGQIYAQAINLADRLCVTHVETFVEGDTSFPAIDPTLWKVTETIDVPAGDKDNYPTRFVVYDRR